MASAISPNWNREPPRPLGRTRQGDDGSVIIRSPLLFEMLARLSTTERKTVLDMGPARQSSLDFFSDYWCKLFFANAVAPLCQLDQQLTQESVAIEQVLRRTIEFYQAHSPELDMILLWNLPNYLAPEHLIALVQYLTAHASRRVKLHTYIYTSEKMPAVPVSYVLRPDASLAMSVASGRQIPCPLYHLAALHKCFAPLRIEHSVMLSSGVQEYVFSL